MTPTFKIRNGKCMSTSGDLPLDLRRYLYDLFAGEMDHMAANGLRHAPRWLVEHEDIVNA